MDKESLRLKHLEFIQTTIARQAQNSFQMKNWTIVVLAALIALYAEKGNVIYLGISLIAVLIFWGLDGYYLHQEKKFRELYDKVVKDINEKTDDVAPFSMDLDDKYGFCRWICACKSKTVFWIYFPIVVGILICLYKFLNQEGSGICGP